MAIALVSLEKKPRQIYLNMFTTATSVCDDSGYSNKGSRDNLRVFYITTIFRYVDVILDVTSTLEADELKDKEVFKRFFK